MATLPNPRSLVSVFTSRSFRTVSFLGLFGLTTSCENPVIESPADTTTPVEQPPVPPVPAEARRLAFLSQPTTSTAGVPLSPAIRVQVQGRNGSPVTNGKPTVTLSITAGTGAAGAVLLGNVTQQAVNGVATFNNVSIQKAGTGYTLTATSSTLSGQASTAFDVLPAAPSQIVVVTQPASVAVGAVMTPAVQFGVRDAYGNTIKGAMPAVTLAIAAGTGTAGAILSGTLSQNAVNGVATFSDLRIDRVGTGYALTASSANVTSASTAPFAVTGTAPAKLVFTQQPTTAASAGVIAPAVQVAVQDAAGNAVSGSTASVTVALAGGASGAALKGTVTKAAINGVATFSDLSVDKASSGYTLTATSSGLTNATSSSFTITPGAAAKLRFTTQPSASNASTPISPAIQVTVQDAQNNTVTSATTNITLSISAGTGTAGAVLGGTLTRSATSGVASFSNITVNLAGTGYTLTAAAAGLTGAVSSAFNVTGTTSSASCANPAPGWIWCDDFEVNRYASYFESSTTFARVAGVGRNGSVGARARWSAGQVDAGNLKLAFGRTPSTYIKPVDAGTKDYREIYWRVYLRHQPGWVGGGADKLSRATIFAKADWSQAMIAHVWSGTGADINYLWAAPASGTDLAGNLQTVGYNDFPHLRWLEAPRTSTALFDANHVGQWFCIETHVKLNTAGQSNGVIEIWINNQLEGSLSNLNYVGSYSAYGINAVMLENWWNAGSPVAQERYMDDFVVSETRIGC